MAKREKIDWDNIPVTVIVEYGDAGAIVGNAVSAAHSVPCDVGEDGYGALRFGDGGIVGFSGAG